MVVRRCVEDCIRLTRICGERKLSLGSGMMQKLFQSSNGKAIVQRAEIVGELLSLLSQVKSLQESSSLDSENQLSIKSALSHNVAS